MPLIGMKIDLWPHFYHHSLAADCPEHSCPVERFLGRKPPALIYNPYGLKVVVWTEVCEIPDISF